MGYCWNILSSGAGSAASSGDADATESNAVRSSGSQTWKKGYQHSDLPLVRPLVIDLSGVASTEDTSVTSADDLSVSITSFGGASGDTSDGAVTDAVRSSGREIIQRRVKHRKNISTQRLTACYRSGWHGID